MVEHIIISYKENRAILRELLGRIHSEKEGTSDLARKTMSSVFEKNVAFLVGSINPKDKKRAEKVLELALISVITVLQNRIIHGESSPIELTIPVSFFKSDLPKMVVAYVKESGIRF